MIDLGHLLAAGCEEQILEQQIDEDQPHSSAQLLAREEHGSFFEQHFLSVTLGHFTCTLASTKHNVEKPLTFY